MAWEDDDPAACLLRKLRKEEADLLSRKAKRLAAKYGPQNFPEIQSIVGSALEVVTERRREHMNVGGVPKLFEDERRLTVCAELEKIIWGRVWTQTASLLEETGGRIDRLIADEEERLRLKAEAAELLRKEEAEAKARTVAETRGPRPVDKSNMKGMAAFDWDAYERQNAGR